MSYPIIKFEFDEILDQNMVWRFYNQGEIAGCNFWKERVLKHYQELQLIENEKDKENYLKNFVFDYYKKIETIFC